MLAARADALVRAAAPACADTFGFRRGGCADGATVSDGFARGDLDDGGRRHGDEIAGSERPWSGRLSVGAFVHGLAEGVVTDPLAGAARRGTAG